MEFVKDNFMFAILWVILFGVVSLSALCNHSIDYSSNEVKNVTSSQVNLY